MWSLSCTWSRPRPSSATLGIRNDPGWPEVGILAQRAKRRVNRIGVTTCELVAVDGLAVTVHSLDAVDGTPVLDLKPHLPAMGPRSAVRAPAWAEAIMEEYFSEA